ncbi:MAG TPA: cytochrome c [Thermoanaerobaculia bacterium]
MAQQYWHTTGKVLAAMIAAGVVVIGVVLALVLRRGLSTRSEPTLIETAIARGVRHLATPSSMHGARNPVPRSSGVLAEARAHWADHCATCHANDGSGNTEIGRGLYPKTPDMRQPRTQELTDGELFSIIRNGVRLTGMPAWGDAAGHDDDDNWKLVHLIRHLPKLTPEELAEMQKLNPKTPDEWQEMQSEAAFLAGGNVAPRPAARSHHSH